MSAIYAGSTPKYLIRIKDSAGTQLDPSDANVVSEVKVIIYNALTGEDIGKFYLNSSPGPGWTQAAVETVTAQDKRVRIVLTAVMTAAAKGNANRIQVTYHLVDAEVPATGQRIIIKQGKFHEVKPSQS